MIELLENKVCIVTGAAGGIGKQISKTFAAAGARVYALDIQEDKLNTWVFDWNKKYIANCIVACSVDLCDSESIKEFIRMLKSRESRIDILVNNAAIISYEFLGMVSITKMKKMFDVNVFGLVEIMQYISRMMVKEKKGSIINIASMVGVNGVAGQLSYSASKGAVISITKSAAKELAQYQIRVNAIAPGMVNTERFSQVMNDKFFNKKEDIPWGRLAEEEEIADLCLYLASDKSKYITGQIIGIDGGLKI